MSKAWRVFGERLKDLRCDKRLSVQAVEGVRCRAGFRRATKRRVAARRGDCVVRVFRLHFASRATSPQGELVLSAEKFADGWMRGIRAKNQTVSQLEEN